MQSLFGKKRVCIMAYNAHRTLCPKYVRPLWIERELILHESIGKNKQRNGRPLYTVTHKGTGLAVRTHIRRKSDAIRMMQKLRKVADWRFGVSQASDRSFMDKLGKATKEIREDCQRAPILG